MENKFVEQWQKAAGVSAEEQNSWEPLPGVEYPVCSKYDGAKFYTHNGDEYRGYIEWVAKAGTRVSTVRWLIGEDESVGSHIVALWDAVGRRWMI